MPWRLIVIILVLGIFLVFIGFNLDNTCDISLGFTTFSGVPVYLTIFVSFMLGMLCSLPFFIFGALRKRPKKESSKGGPTETTGKTAGPAPDPAAEETGPYGVN
ncbi:hypothetical protein AGMMS50230_02780 [Spirochaetia bacterium]|nr:hypothetical protein AGMMS50230_02780 [Spirochaetia bacterium]